MIPRYFDLYLNAGTHSPLVFHANQYDSSEQWVFTLYKDDGTKYTPTAGAIVGMKADGHAIENAATIDESGRVVVTETEQMTAAAGTSIFELVLSGVHGTANFTVLVEPRPADNDADYSESDLSLISQAIAMAIDSETVAALQVGLQNEAQTRFEQDTLLRIGGENEAATRAAADAVLRQAIDDAAIVPAGSTVVVDNTLSIAGAAADAKKTGDAVSDLNQALSEISYPRNIFTSVNATAGKYLNPNDGALVNDANYSVSDYIPVDANANYTLKVYTNKMGTSGAQKQHFYDASFTETIVIGTLKNSNTWCTVKSPADASYMRVTYNNADASIFQILKGEELYTDIDLPSKKQLLKDYVILGHPVSVDNLDIISKNAFVNIFNPDDAEIIDEHYVTYSGNLVENYDLNVSGFIPLIFGETYIFPVYPNYFGNSSNLTYVSLYNENKEYVANVHGTRCLVNGEADSNGAFLKITISTSVPSAKYFRVNFHDKDVNSNFILSAYHAKSMFMVIKADAMPDAYSPYGRDYTMKTTVQTYAETKDNPIFQKSVVFLGDSICEGDADGGWAKRIGTKNEMLWINQGIGGSTISMALAGKIICTRDIKMSNPDIIILEGGTNDADRIGDATGETKPERFGTWSESDYGTNDSENYYGFDIDTYCGACDYMFRRFTSEYAGAKIGFIGAQKMGTTDTTRANRGYYIKTAMDIAKKWGVPCLDLWNGCYLLPVNPAHYTSGEDYMYVDGQHLTANGYDYISPMIEAWIKTL